MAHILEINNLTKRFTGFELKNISFSLEQGFIMGFIGPNGAGKTTTIKLIMNLLKKDSGEIKVFDLDNIKKEQTIKQKVGFVYNDDIFYEELTVEEMKNIIAPFYQNWDNKLFHNYAKQFDIDNKQKIKKLSKGMKTKFALAIALSHNPRLLIMDEPTAGLDPIFRTEILEILAELIQDENKGILFSTHITSDLDKIADYITFINKGQLIFSEPKDNLLDNYRIVKGNKELLTSNTRKHFVSIKEHNFGFEGLVTEVTKIKSAFDDSVVIEKPSLEDIMVYTVRGGNNA